VLTLVIHRLGAAAGHAAVIQPDGVGGAARVHGQRVPAAVARRPWRLQRPAGREGLAAISRSRDLDTGGRFFRVPEHDHFRIPTRSRDDRHARGNFAAHSRVALDGVHAHRCGKRLSAIAAHGQEHVGLAASRGGPRGRDEGAVAGEPRRLVGTPADGERHAGRARLRGGHVYPHSQR